MKKLKYLFLIMLFTFMSVTSVNAEVPTGEQYSEFATNKTLLLGLYTSHGEVNLYAYTPRLNEFLNGSLSLVRYENSTNDVYSNWAIRIYQSARSNGNYTMNWVTEWVDSTTAHEFCSAAASPLPKGGVTNSTVCNVVGNTAYFSMNYKLNVADTGTAYVDFEMVSNGISINWFLRLVNAVYYPQIIESSYIDTETLTQQQQTIINQNQQQIIQNNTIINQQQQTNDKLNEVIEKDKVCTYIDKNNVTSIDKVLSSNGSIANSTNGGLTDYIKVSKSDKLQIKKEGTWGSLSTCFYNVNKQLISCTPNTSLSVNQYLTIPDNTSYARFSIQLNSNQPQFELCKNGNQALNDNLNDLNQNISSDKIDGVEGAFESFEGFIAENSTITQLITMPITLYTSILNGLQSACQPFVLGNLFGTNLTIPCVNIGNYLGSTLWSMIDIIISGFAVFAISKKFIKIFNNFSSMKEGDVIND